MKLKTVLLLGMMLLTIAASAQKNIDKMRPGKRDPILIEIAKDAVKKYAPDYYREYGMPIIKRFVADKKSLSAGFGDVGAKIGRVFYSVAFPYDTSKEYFSLGFSAEVCIWEDTGWTYAIMTGSGEGFTYSENKTRGENEEVKIIPFKKSEKPKDPIIWPESME